ncbi:SufD family Fe-S cluster assembly protein [Candidatus Dependentiae bacterium]|nr:SufD family Fe-S cluster assembly protein [Candidatus Dependentiae bacterium]
MNDLNNFMQWFLSKNIVIQDAEIDQSIMNEGAVAYRCEKNKKYTFNHQLLTSFQKIYIFLDQEASVVFQINDLEQPNILDIEYVIVLESKSQLVLHFVLLYSLKMNIKITIYAQGEESVVSILGLYALDKKQEVVIETGQYHLGKKSKTNLLFHGILKNSASIRYQGLISVDLAACGTYASQFHKNMVIGPHTRVVSIPSIQVLPQDAKCYHGVTIGDIDEIALWYLQTKGFSSKMAKRCLIKSFFHEVTQGIKDKDEVMDRLCKKMILM